MINIDDLSVGQIKEIQRLLVGGDQPQPSPVKIGEAYLFRTVTHIELGRVTEIMGRFVRLEDASWVANTGRYYDALLSGVLEEVEPYPVCTTVNMGSRINVTPWPHRLPRAQRRL